MLLGFNMHRSNDVTCDDTTSRATIFSYILKNEQKYNFFKWKKHEYNDDDEAGEWNIRGNPFF